MIAVLVLFVAATVAGGAVPRLLIRLDPARWDPLVLLVGWLVSIACVLLTSAAGVVLLLIPGHGAVGDLVSLLHECWVAVVNGHVDGEALRAEKIVGLLGVLGLLALMVRFTVISVRSAHRRGRIRDHYLALLRIGARRQDGASVTTLWLDHDRPLAFSMSGSPGVVVATDGLTRHLGQTEVAAVLAHEHAHLSGRHHQVLAWVDALAAALPVVPLFRQAPVSVRVLLELSADVAAVRACGPDAVRSALLTMSADPADTVPGPALAMAGNGVEVRLARLHHGGRPAGRLRRAVSCGAAATTAVTLPIATSVWMLLLAVVIVSCPLAII